MSPKRSRRRSELSFKDPLATFAQAASNQAAALPADPERDKLLLAKRTPQPT